MKISIMKRTGRKYYEAQWIDPVTGKARTRSTKKTKYREAVEFVADLKKELKNPSIVIERIPWKKFRERYEGDAFLGKATKTAGKDRSTLNKIEQVINPEYLDVMSRSEVIERFKQHLYSEKLEAYTIKGHLSITRKMLKWAKKRKLIAELPVIDVPRKVTGKRGRPITKEEFDRIIDKVESVVGPDGVESWSFLLQGLWWGGLRLEEAMVLHWTDDSEITVDYSGKRPMFLIQGEAEKARTNRVLPMAPEFAKLISDRDRTGFVFNPKRRMPPHFLRLSAEHVGKVISEIGEAANVKVSEIKGKPKYASAHDLRRSFGFRWAMKVLPPVLMELMRHDHISTTMVYYVGRNAQVAADAAWDAVADSTNISTNTDDVLEKPSESETP